MSDSLGLVDFAIGLVNSVINLPDGKMKFFEKFKLQKYFQINLLIKTFLGLVEKMFGLVNIISCLCRCFLTGFDHRCSLPLNDP